MTNQQEALARALSIERELLAQMEELIEQLPQDSPYREVIERHLNRVREAVEQVEELSENQD